METANSGEPAESPSDDKVGDFECNICLDTVKDAVVTPCGHLFCWPCLRTWLEGHGTCPVCKSGVDRDKVIPVYGKNSSQKDPRDQDPRPRGQRTEPPQQNRGFFGDGGFQMSFGIGAFPFGFIASSVNMGTYDDRPSAPPTPSTPAAAGSLQEQQEQMLSYVLIAIAIFFMAGVLLGS